jgi:hypothetical protein
VAAAEHRGRDALSTPAGYSGTPLAKKLGIDAGARVFTAGAPASYPALLAPLPEGVSFTTRPGPTTSVAHVFVTKKSTLARHLSLLRKVLAPGTPLWVSWPKKSSGVASEVGEDGVRELALPLGWVDVKVCAVDETWSGLKLVVRKELR